VDLAYEYYNANIYWNNFYRVNDYFNESIAGDKSNSWITHVLNKTGKFTRGFFVNCGNGWVERECFQLGLIAEAAGFDLNENYIEQARRTAGEIGLCCEYFLCDCNDFVSEGKKEALVVNYAAMHHVIRINHLTYNLAKMLKPDGYYVGLDYVGPHRNQYPWEMWAEMIRINDGLPSRYQVPLIYPHINTMLITDPTEAVHSELQLEVFGRYFDVLEYIPLGGAIAYSLLFNNATLLAEQHTSDGVNSIEKILQADKSFTKQNPSLTLFAFWLAQPKSSDFPCSRSVHAWQLEEDEREKHAASQEGRYYPKTSLEIIYNKFDESKRDAIFKARQELNSRIHDSEQACQELTVRIHDYEQKINRNESELAGLNEHVARLRQENDRLHKEIVGTQADHNTLKRKHTALITRHSSVLQSSSWRYTKPFRALIALLRAFFGLNSRFRDAIESEDSGKR
jgi:SAM-dependent methyltransferase